MCFASFLFVLLIAASQFAAEDLLIVDLYARIVPEGQTEPIPDPYIQGIINGVQEAVPPGVQQLQSKAFRVKSRFADFQAVIPGVEGQRVELSFTGTLLPNGTCAVTDFQLGAASESSTGNVLPSNSSQTMSRSGFTVAPGQKISQSVSVQSKGGQIFYFLIFSAAKAVVD